MITGLDADREIGQAVAGEQKLGGDGHVAVRKGQELRFPGEGRQGGIGRRGIRHEAEDPTAVQHGRRADGGAPEHDGQADGDEHVLVGGAVRDPAELTQGGLAQDGLPEQIPAFGARQAERGEGKDFHAVLLRPADRLEDALRVEGAVRYPDLRGGRRAFDEAVTHAGSSFRGRVPARTASL